MVSPRQFHEFMWTCRGSINLPARLRMVARHVKWPLKVVAYPRLLPAYIPIALRVVPYLLRRVLGRSGATTGG